MARGVMRGLMVRGSKIERMLVLALAAAGLTTTTSPTCGSSMTPAQDGQAQ